MKYTLKINKKMVSFELLQQGDAYEITLDEKEYDAELIRIDSNLYSLIVNGSTYTIAIEKEGKRIELFFKGDLFSYEIPSVRDKGGTENTSGIDKISAPMPGRVVKILKSIGDMVSEGEGVVVVEAMKMESELKTTIDGKITGISVKEGDTVDLGSHILTVESQDKK
tara:strand:+ start:97 stop:597 length:501 start_codon:yes stop_codon:yes gene_type:complete